MSGHLLHETVTNLINKFDDDQLQNVAKCVYLVDAVTQIVQCSILYQQQK